MCVCVASCWHIVVIDLLLPRVDVLVQSVFTVVCTYILLHLGREHVLMLQCPVHREAIAMLRVIQTQTYSNGGTTCYFPFSMICYDFGYDFVFVGICVAIKCKISFVMVY